MKRDNCYRFIIVSLSIQRIVQSVIQPLGCNGFLIKLSIYLTGMISMNGMTGIKGMTRMTRNDLTLDEWND